MGKNIKPILARLEQELSNGNVVQALITLEPTDLQSLLLHVFEECGKKVVPSTLLRAAQSNRFVCIAPLDQRAVLAFDCAAYDSAPCTYRGIELSPVTPLGTNSSLTNVNQKNVLSTIRNTEVVADPTTALALYCALERKRQRTLGKTRDRVQICSSHRMLRTQVFEESLEFTPHFRAFAMAVAGKDEGSEVFETDCLLEHIRTYLKLMVMLPSKFEARETTVALSHIGITEKMIKRLGLDRQVLGSRTDDTDFEPFNSTSFTSWTTSLGCLPQGEAHDLGIETEVEQLKRIGDGIIPRLRSEFPDVKFGFDLNRVAGIGYYQGASFKISSQNKSGERFPLADGGMSNWMQLLLNDRKERILTSGFGSELFCRKFSCAS